MGRKPKDKKESFTTISVRVTPEQRRLIEARSKELCMPGVATYCRTVLLKDAAKLKKAA